MTNENEEITNDGTAMEKLEGIAQAVIGEIQSLGGVITGDAMTSAEGDFNVQVGTLHQESADALSETSDETESQNPAQSIQTEISE